MSLYESLKAFKSIGFQKSTKNRMCNGTLLLLALSERVKPSRVSLLVTIPKYISLGGILSRLKVAETSLS